MRYPFKEIENKWQKFWNDNEVYKTDLTNTDKKLYCLVMFIYPSGAKLHCGHWYNYGPTDTWARYKKLTGYNVFEPMGYDAFGLPAENFAIKTGVHPYDSTLKNIDDIRSQLQKMGCMYDWNAELMTCTPEYYKWNQWLFIQLYKNGLAYRKNAPVNWCPSCDTVLANEQVLATGGCERCNTTVIQKNLTQWFFRITKYADELLEGLNKINWPDKTKTMQRNWIGKSFGTEVTFKVDNSESDLVEEIKVFTTRPDTLFGVTYLVLAPEHPLVDKLTSSDCSSAVNHYRDSIKSLSETDRTSTVKEKTGVPIGAFAINPVNSSKVPIWIADYALITYGTGAVMAVPGHDERDFEFAAKFNLPVKKVILQPDTEPDCPLTAAYTEVGTMINSSGFNGQMSDVCADNITEFLETRGLGKRKTNYRLRDWLISRQRYWGTPIPVIHCEDCGEVLVGENDLPVNLPYEVEFKSKGKSPLTSNADFMNVKCPQCGKDAQRDPDTMDTFVDSSWYYLRYLNPKFSEGIFDAELAQKWTPVDMYVGGAEHATMHLLYARFIHKFLRDIGLTDSDEPFQTLIHQGTITNQGAKMSKSKGNVINPDDYIKDIGADVFRLYLMFMGPYEMGGDWNDKGISGTERFVQRTYDLFMQFPGIAKSKSAPVSFNISELSDQEKSVYRKVNQTLHKYNGELSAFRFNTAIAAMMELINELSKNLSYCKKELISYSLERFAIMLSPLAPHLGEECWQMIGHEDSLYVKPVWFEVDPAALTVDSVSIAVQVNGKLRGTVEVPVNAGVDVVKEKAFTADSVSRHIEGKMVIKEIFVVNKILNIVVK